jgi:hypothetical protein
MKRAIRRLLAVIGYLIICLSFVASFVNGLLFGVAVNCYL